MPLVLLPTADIEVDDAPFSAAARDLARASYVSLSHVRLSTLTFLLIDEDISNCLDRQADMVGVGVVDGGRIQSKGGTCVGVGGLEV